jgi:hypothetical protein
MFVATQWVNVTHKGANNHGMGKITHNQTHLWRRGLWQKDKGLPTL